jgi:hypothetical protein
LRNITFRITKYAIQGPAHIKHGQALISTCTFKSRLAHGLGSGTKSWDGDEELERVVIGLDEREIQRLNMIVVDEDKDEALVFLRDVILRKIKEIPKSTGCYPRDFE